MVNKKQ